MGKVILDMAVSLDGFVSGPNGEDAGLHNYFFSPSSESAKVIEEGIKTTGAIIMGRRTYDVGAQQDGFVDTPYNAANFVITHEIPEKAAKGAESFVFVTDGIESALEQAKAAAGERDAVIGGGANVAQQYLKAGLVDEIQIHLISVLLGNGICLFDSTQHIELENIRVVAAPGVTHLQYRVVK